MQIDRTMTANECDGHLRGVFFCQPTILPCPLGSTLINRGDFGAGALFTLVFFALSWPALVARVQACEDLLFLSGVCLKNWVVID